MTEKTRPVLDHIHLRSTHLDQAMQFYRAVFEALGRGAVPVVGGVLRA